jgi:hypothetical protein
VFVNGASGMLVIRRIDLALEDRARFEDALAVWDF